MFRNLINIITKPWEISVRMQWFENYVISLSPPALAVDVDEVATGEGRGAGVALGTPWFSRIIW